MRRTLFARLLKDLSALPEALIAPYKEDPESIRQLIPTILNGRYQLRQGYNQT